MVILLTEPCLVGRPSQITLPENELTSVQDKSAGMTPTALVNSIIEANTAIGSSKLALPNATTMVIAAPQVSHSGNHSRYIDHGHSHLKVVMTYVKTVAPTEWSSRSSAATEFTAADRIEAS
jgi:hypothetical protein